jgi:hypothetical protein
MDAGRAVMEPPLRAARSWSVAAMPKPRSNRIERTFAAAHRYATLWCGGLYADRRATVKAVAVEAAAIARIVGAARKD